MLEWIILFSRRCACPPVHEVTFQKVSESKQDYSSSRVSWAAECDTGLSSVQPAPDAHIPSAPSTWCFFFDYFVLPLGRVAVRRAICVWVSLGDRVLMSARHMGFVLIRLRLASRKRDRGFTVCLLPFYPLLFSICSFFLKPPLFIRLHLTCVHTLRIFCCCKASFRLVTVYMPTLWKIFLLRTHTCIHTQSVM